MQDDATFDEIFSDQLRDLFSRIKMARSKQERITLMLEFSEAFASEYDPSDFTANESFHKFIEDFEAAKLAYTQASMQLARMGLDFMTSMSDNDSKEEAKPAASPTESRLN